MPASTLMLTIPTTRILDDHAEYGVSSAVNSGNSGAVVVWRRYKDFENLRSAIKKTSRSPRVPELPSKHSWWTSRSAEVVNERQRHLEAFLRELESSLERPSQGWTILCQFAGVSPSVTSREGSTTSTSTTVVVRREGEEMSNVLREEVLRLQNQLAMLEEEESKLKLDLAAKDTELSTLRNKRVDAKQIKEQSTQLEKEKNHLTVEVARLEALVNSAGDAQHELNLVKEEDLRLKNEIAVLDGERNDLRAALVRHEELVESLRREVARLEEESAKMQEEITTLQRQLENNPNEENLRGEVNRLKKENGALQLEITRLEQAQQSAAAYGASVLAKLEKLEKEKSEQLAQARMTIEAEAKISGQMRARLEALQDELARFEQARNSAIEQANSLSAALQRVEKEKFEYVEQTKIRIEEETNNSAQMQRRLEALQNEIARLEDERKNAVSQVESVTVKLQSVEKERYEFTEQTKVRIHEETNNNAQLQKQIQVLQQEIAQLEETKQSASSHIESISIKLQTVEKEKNEYIEQTRFRLEEETKRSAAMKQEIETLRHEMAQLDKALQSAAQYGDNVTLKLENVEKEKSEQLEKARLRIEEEEKNSAQLRARIAELEQQLKSVRADLVEASRMSEQANNQAQEAIAANELLKVSLSGEESELVTLRKEVQSLQDRLATIYAEYEILKARSRAGDGEIEVKLETLGKQVIEYKAESDKNANIKVKLAARVDALVAENLHLREKNFSLERRMKLLQGD